MSYLKRLSYYSREQLHPGSRLFLSAIIAVFVQLLFDLNFKTKTSFSMLIVPTIAPFLLLLYYRISDEFKDYETDKKYFPDRPIPSGRVQLKDLTSLLIIFSVIAIAMNLISPFALKEFFAAWIFTVLMGKWFFMEKWISNNRLIAFITHAPVGFFLYLYVIRYYQHALGVEIQFNAILSLIGFIVLPGLTWEVLRKTFLPKDEMPGYQTYSIMLGFKGSLLFSILFILVTILNNFLLIEKFIILAPLAIPLTAFNLLMLFGVLLQMVKPWVQNLRTATELYMGLHLIVPLAYLLWLNYV